MLKLYPFFRGILKEKVIQKIVVSVVIILFL